MACQAEFNLRNTSLHIFKYVFNRHACNLTPWKSNDTSGVWWPRAAIRIFGVFFIFFLLYYISFYLFSLFYLFYFISFVLFYFVLFSKTIYYRSKMKSKKKNVSKMQFNSK